MLMRATIAFIALPGVVAYAVPVLIGIQEGRPMRHLALGLSGVILGTSLLLWCAYEFHSIGRGTLAPWSPPQHLVTTGLYRFSRNPMYIGVTTILLGWCVAWSSPLLVFYAAVAAVAFHVRVVIFEEPWAARQFGAQWDAYRDHVPRWLM
jgi:protein-S-isoprenylcysteine O-methyltransferase Ste14